MKKSLQEELERIHSLTYGKTLNEGLFKKEDEPKDDPKKADEVSGETDEFYKTLEDASVTGLSQQEKGSMEFTKGVESMQIGLILLGYQLPKWGVDGLFGPETSSAINRFMSDNKLEPTEGKLTSVSGEVIKLLIEKLKSRGVESSELKQHVDQINTSELVDKNFYERLLENLGAPITDENLKFLYAWRQAEGSGGRYNPFNTTHGMPGDTKINSHGVRSYKNIEDGMIATIKTLKNGRYDCIVNGMINDIGAANIASCKSLKTWGTGDLVAKVVRGYDRGADPKIKSIA